MIGLTARQAQVLRFIARSTFEHGYPPTLREICVAIGVKSTNGANDHLHALERKSMVRRPVQPLSRGVVLTEQGRAWIANNPEPVAPLPVTVPTELAESANIKTRGVA